MKSDPYWGKLQFDSASKETVMNLLNNPSSAHDTVTRFEHDLSDFLGNNWLVGVCNGTMGIVMALMAVGLRTGDHVVVPDFTFASVANSILLLGGKPVVIDSDPGTYNLSAEQLKRALTDFEGRITGILHVDVGGVPGNLDEIGEICEKYGVWLIEDAAEALGSEYNDKKIGSFDHTTVFSFHTAKQLPTFEGGAVTFGNKESFEKARLIVNHGMKNTYEHIELGLNFRINPLSAALALPQVRNLNRVLSEREKFFRFYSEHLRDFLSFQAVSSQVTNVSWGLILAVSRDRRRLFDGSNNWSDHEASGIRRTWIPLHQQRLYKGKILQIANSYPVAETIAGYGLTLPLYNQFDEQIAKKVTGYLRSVLPGR